MSISRWRMDDQVINSNHEFHFSFKGRQSNGKSGSNVNAIWNFKTLADEATADRHANKMDMIDRYPESGGDIAVYVNGSLQEEGAAEDFVLTAQNANANPAVDPKITFNKSIADDANVSFII